MDKNLCLYCGKTCEYADEYSECRIGQQNCKRFGWEVSDDFDYIDDYLDYDLYDED